MYQAHCNPVTKAQVWGTNSKANDSENHETTNYEIPLVGNMERKDSIVRKCQKVYIRDGMKLAEENCAANYSFVKSI